MATPEQIHLAGRFMLALADEDHEQARGVFDECLASPDADQAFGLAITLADYGIQAVRALVDGDPQWRDLLVTSLHALELSDLDTSDDQPG